MMRSFIVALFLPVLLADASNHASTWDVNDCPIQEQSFSVDDYVYWVDPGRDWIQIARSDRGIVEGLTANRDKIKVRFSPFNENGPLIEILPEHLMHANCAGFLCAPQWVKTQSMCETETSGGFGGQKDNELCCKPTCMYFQEVAGYPYYDKCKKGEYDGKTNVYEEKNGSSGLVVEVGDDEVAAFHLTCCDTTTTTTLARTFQLCEDQNDCKSNGYPDCDSGGMINGTKFCVCNVGSEQAKMGDGLKCDLHTGLWVKKGSATCNAEAPGCPAGYTKRFNYVTRIRTAYEDGEIFCAGDTCDTTTPDSPDTLQCCEPCDQHKPCSSSETEGEIRYGCTATDPGRCGRPDKCFTTTCPEGYDRIYEAATTYCEGFPPFNQSCDTRTTDSQDFDTCCTETTTTTTTTTITTTTTTSTILMTFIAGSMTLDVELPDGTSASQFIRDNNVKEGLKAGIASSHGAKVTKDMVDVTLSMSSSGGRRLADKVGIKVDYTIKVPASDTQTVADIEEEMGGLDPAVVSAEVNYSVNEAMGLTTVMGAKIFVTQLGDSGNLGVEEQDASSADRSILRFSALWMAAAVGMASSL